MDKLGGIDDKIGKLPGDIADAVFNRFRVCLPGNGGGRSGRPAIDKVPVLPIPFGPDVGDIKDAWRMVRGAF